MNDEAPRDASPAERAQEELLQLKNRAVAKALFGADQQGLARSWWRSLLQKAGLVK